MSLARESGTPAASVECLHHITTLWNEGELRNSIHAFRAPVSHQSWIVYLIVVGRLSELSASSGIEHIDRLTVDSR